MVATVFIDGNDLYAEYGLILLRGSYDGLMQPPKRKASLQNNWQDQDGLDIDLTDPHWEEKEVDLKFLMTATSEAMWWVQYNAFFTLVKGAARHVLQVTELNQSFNFYYKEVSNYTQITTITNRSLVAAQFTMKIGI
jgi:hypothetical protein